MPIAVVSPTPSANSPGPIKHLVFLHDTPSRALSDPSARAFSSGCIRVEHPFELAEKVLDDPQK